jgi:hypothetical protein
MFPVLQVEGVESRQDGFRKAGSVSSRVSYTTPDAVLTPDTSLCSGARYMHALSDFLFDLW